MIASTDVIKIHHLLIERFVGIKGVRDKGSLEPAINRPFATFDSRELYPTPAEKAAAILESILINHPFLDGNKRTAYVLMRLILLHNDMDLNANKDEKYKLVISASTGEMRFEEIKNWNELRLKKKN